MELDKRIIEGKKPLDCFDVDIARQFIGKKGYFSNSLGWYSVLKRTWYGTLDEIESDLEQCFYDGESEGYFQYFLPAEWVKEPETPKFMPYTLDTWEQDFKPGDTVVFRDKEDATEYKFVYSGYIKHPNNLISVSFGPYLYTFYDLFNSYEIYRNGNWEPFGKEIEE